MKRAVAALLVAACGGGDATGAPDAPRGGDAGADALRDGAIDARPPLLGVDCAAPLTAPPAALALDPFYTKYLDIAGLPLISSSVVRDAAFPVACDILVHMLAKRPEIIGTLAQTKIRVGIMAESEVTTDMPEHSDLDEAFPGTDWDTRARGLGATAARPLSSVGEENLLQLPSDVYAGENILVHEFGHTFFDMGVARGPGGSARLAELTSLYNAAIQAGTYANTYAATNYQEYWAEALQSYYDVNLEAVPSNGIHNAIDTRVELRAADPDLVDFIELYFEDDAYRP